MTFDLEQEVKKANREIPEAVSSELYNAALEAIDEHEAHRHQEYPEVQIPDRLYQALKVWTKQEYRKHLEHLTSPRS